MSGWKQAFIPFLDWLGELKNKDTVRADIIAGITVALVLVPQSMAFAIMWGVRRYAPQLPGVLIAVVVTTLIAWLAGFGEAGGKVVGDIPKGLPALSIPAFDLKTMWQLIPAAITISLIGFMEAISIAKAMAARTRQRLNANQELIGQGLSNVVASMFSGYPVSGSFSRSAVNINAGALTGFSSVVTGLVVAITLIFLTPLLYHLPQATLVALFLVPAVTASWMISICLEGSMMRQTRRS
ncbi:MAG: hypothetical protein KZQ97_16780 [Candidatus Thiodiazotropha sp. (ex Dulcina madagascariensis)]|nr:hypothetical protein [Candidatus Thiodiazotropha sp. (ex Dulcina madagascariensis)]